MQIRRDTAPQCARNDAHEGSELKRGEAEPSHAAKGGKHERFGKELADKAAAFSAYRGAYGNLLTAGRQATQHQVGDIDTGNQQYEPGCDPDQVQALLAFCCKRVAQGLDEDPSVLVRLWILLPIGSGDDLEGCRCLPDRDVRLQAADHVQPRDPPAKRLDGALLRERHPQLGCRTLDVELFGQHADDLVRNLI